MIRSLAVLVLLTAGCASRPPAPTSAPAAESPPSAATCLADTLPLLSGKIEPRDCPGTVCVDACNAGDPHACWTQAALLVADPATRADAEPLFLRACTLGHGNACTNHAAFMWTQSKPEDPSYECARRIFELSCPTDDHFACGMDGRLRLERGEGDDLERGRAILERSCIKLRGFPCHILALNLERGVLPGGTPERIRDLLREACAGGDDAACGDPATAAKAFEAP